MPASSLCRMRHVLCVARRPSCRSFSLRVVNPCTEETIATLEPTPQTDIPKLVAAARDAHEYLATLPRLDQHLKRFMGGISKRLHNRRSELIDTEVKNTGKPYPEAEAEVDDAIGVFRYVAAIGATRQPLGFRRSPRRRVDGVAQHVLERYTTHTLRVPSHVVAIITPWNYPLMTACWKVSGALSSGCAAVLKPSEVTPLTALILQECVHKAAAEASVPKDIFHVVLGDGELGNALATDAGVDNITFTGSTSTGRKILQASGTGRIRRCTLELGGKSPTLVMSDADLGEANIEWMVYGAMVNAGQVCSSTSRVIVAASRVHELEHALAAFMRSRLRVGPPDATLSRRKQANVGPIIHRAQRDRVLALLAGALSEGAVPVIGHTHTHGFTPPHLAGAPGFWVQPTLLTNVSPQSTIWREEVFGPVLTVTVAPDDDGVLAMANDTEYGLAASVYTRSRERFEHVARRLRAGVIWHNCSQVTPVWQPWGGFRASGYGRLLGEAPRDAFSELAAITSLTPDAHRLSHYSLPGVP